MIINLRGVYLEENKDFMRYCFKCYNPVLTVSRYDAKRNFCQQFSIKFSSVITIYGFEFKFLLDLKFKLEAE